MQKLYAPFVDGPGAVGFLILRLVMGAAFIQHGYTKIETPFHWMHGMPHPAPAFLQGLAALSEFGGGIALILGLLTPLASLGIICTMATAILKVHLPAGAHWIGGKTESFELPLLYLAIALLFLLAGPGRLSLDAALFGSVPRAKRRF